MLLRTLAAMPVPSPIRPSIICECGVRGRSALVTKQESSWGRQQWYLLANNRTEATSALSNLKNWHSEDYNDHLLGTRLIVRARSLSEAGRIYSRPEPD